MKKWLLLPAVLFLSFSNYALDWPLELKTKKGGTIIIYQPQPESFEGNILKGRAALSVKEIAGNEPTFGVLWFTAKTLTDRDTRMVSLEELEVSDVKFPDFDDQEKIQQLKNFVSKEVMGKHLEISLDDILATLEFENPQTAEDLSNKPPVILYKTEPTLLVFMDGEPKIEKDNDLKIEKIINTPFLIIKAGEDKKFYLYEGNFWYSSGEPKSGYSVTKTLPASVQKIDKEIKSQEKEDGQVVSEEIKTILVVTQPTELIQSKGKADFASIKGTSLLYMSNSDDQIFMDVNSQKYFTLISGRWYSSSSLESTWEYISSDKLPADFAKIPEGSEKDEVLASVAGTQAAKEAVMDAQIPQTAKVDRATATTTVKYDGEPKFEPIEGTSMSLAMNTSSTVLLAGGKYFCVDNGVWFVAANATGPWKVSEERPKDVDKIPASNPAYNVKYVYIYDTTPQYVYVGYTPGYMGCYVYGPTVVYGTGYYYNPWYGPYYYPRPVTYGFSMHYNPWTGWSFGFHYSVGCFSFHSYHGGYWGPPVYRPPYRPPYYGHYGGRPVHYNNINVNVNNNRTVNNNIYKNRNNISTRNVKPTSRPTTRPATTNRPATQPGNRNNVYSDRQGNVYQRDNKGDWNQRQNNQWKPTNQNQQNNIQQMNRSSQMRDRSSQRNNSFQQQRQPTRSAPARRTGGGRRN